MIRSRAVIVVSKADVAGMTIKNALLNEFDFEWRGGAYWHNDLPLIEIDEPSIYADRIEELVDSKIIIFATRHAAVSGYPSLLTHTPGNWTDQTPLGGLPRRVCIASARAMKIAANELKEWAERLGLEGWRVGVEVTHHGPYVSRTPVIFVELGSTEREWRDETAAVAVAHAAMKVAREFDSDRNWVYAVGFGGPHYAPRFLSHVFGDTYAVGHIIPNYVFDEVTEREIRMAFERTLEKPDTALIDWKGLKGRHKRKLLPVLKDMGVTVERA